MYDLFIEIPDLDLIEKSIYRAPKPGHKYISRKRKGGRWVYKYRKTKTSKHGHHHAGSEEEHSVDIHADSHNYAHSPERGYQHTTWMREIVDFLASPRRKVLKLKGADGKTDVVIRATGKTAYPYRVLDGKKQIYMKSTDHLVRWVQKKVNAPFEVVDSAGMIHHTLTPAIAQAGREAGRRAWMTARFNKDHPFDPYRGSKKDSRVFRDIEEYQSWWARWTQLMMGRRGASKVKVGPRTMESRPMTSLLETGQLPFRVEEYKSPKTKLPALRWRIDFEGGRVSESEFMKQFPDEHAGMLISIVAKNLARFYPSDAKARKELFDDAKSQGQIGLLEAAHRFDPAKGFRFTSYAYSYIDSSIRNFLQKKLTARVKAAKPKKTSPEKVSAAVESELDKYSQPVDLDMETQHLLKEAWRRAQEKNFENTLAEVGPETDEGIAVFQNYLDFSETRTYDEAQDWVSEHMDKPWVLPIDEPSTYIKTMEERREILGDRAGKKLSQAERDKAEKRWRKIVSNHFAKKGKKAKTKSEKSYHKLVNDIFLKMLPSGADFTPKYSFLQLADMFKQDIERQFGNPKKPILTAIQRQDQIKRMLESELPELAASPAVLKFQKESPLRKALNLDIAQALLGVWVDLVRERLIEKAVNPQSAFFRRLRHDPEDAQGWAHDLRKQVLSALTPQFKLRLAANDLAAKKFFNYLQNMGDPDFSEHHPSDQHFSLAKAIKLHKEDSEHHRLKDPASHLLIQKLGQASYKDTAHIYRGTAVADHHVPHLVNAGATFHAGHARPWTTDLDVAQDFAHDHAYELSSRHGKTYHPVVFHVPHPRYGTDVSHIAGYPHEREVVSGGNFQVASAYVPGSAERPFGLRGPSYGGTHTRLVLKHLPHDMSRPVRDIHKSGSISWIDPEIEAELQELFHRHHRSPIRGEVKQKIAKALTSLWVDLARPHLYDRR
tara:strand:- start:2373 stop:5210 length:2838 start_codon:yes stop_codon:yes gene_type:complete